MVKVQNACLVNILLDQPVVPELLQQACVPEKLANAVGSLLSDAGLRQTMQQHFQKVVALLSPPQSVVPSVYAARVIKEVMWSFQRL
jgi:lipid-A-disaccharide synthase